MDTNKILTADILDLLFDNRNKEYGAYELRSMYQKRITKALLITTLFALLAFAAVVLAGSIKNNKSPKDVMKEVILTEVKFKEKPPEKLPEPERRPEPQRSVIFNTPVIVEQVTQPLPTQDEVDSAKIDVVKQEGRPDNGIPDEKEGEGNNENITQKSNLPNDEIAPIVDIPAKCNCNWENFLRKNLNAQVAIDNGAPPGNHKVIIQFVVDKEGNISDIRPMSNVGFGMEQEAIRVLKKATKWEPAMYNGQPVKAYRQQPITF